MAGGSGVKGACGVTCIIAGFPCSVSGFHSESREELFDSISAHSVSGSRVRLSRESCPRFPALLGPILAMSPSAFSPVPASIRDDGIYDSSGSLWAVATLPAVGDRRSLGRIAPSKPLTPSCLQARWRDPRLLSLGTPMV